MIIFYTLSFLLVIGFSTILYFILTGKLLRGLAQIIKLESLTKKESLIFVICNGIITFAIQLSLYRFASNYINFIKIDVLLVLLTLIAVIDWKSKLIPNRIILAGLFFRSILYIVEFLLYREEFRSIVMNDLIGLGFGFGALFLVAVISRHALGFGDVKLFGMIGFYCGFIATYATLFIGVCLTAIVSLVLLLTKKKGRKDSVPFAPFVYMGFVFTILFVLY